MMTLGHTLKSCLLKYFLTLCLLKYFLATLVALHLTSVSRSVGHSFGLAQLGACELVEYFPKGIFKHINMNTDYKLFGLGQIYRTLLSIAHQPSDCKDSLLLTLLVQDNSPTSSTRPTTDQEWEYDGKLFYGIAVLAQIARSIGG